MFSFLDAANFLCDAGGGVSVMIIHVVIHNALVQGCGFLEGTFDAHEEVFRDNASAPDEGVVVALDFHEHTGCGDTIGRLPVEECTQPDGVVLF